MSREFRLETPLRVARARVLALRQELAALRRSVAAAEEELERARESMNEAHQNLADVALGGGESMELAAYVAMQEAACRWVRLGRARLADWTERVDAVTAQLLVETRRVDVLGEAKERDARETQRELAKKSQRTLDDAFSSRRLREARFLRKAVR